MSDPTIGIELRDVARATHDAAINATWGDALYDATRTETVTAMYSATWNAVRDVSGSVTWDALREARP